MADRPMGDRAGIGAIMNGIARRLSLGLLIGAMTAAPVAAQSTDDDSVTGMPGGILTIDPELRARERTLNAFVQQILEATDGERTRLYERIEEIDLRMAAMSAIEANLAIQRADLLPRLAEEAVREARAVFDPVFTFGFNGTRTEFNDRVESVLRFRRETEAIAVGETDPRETNPGDQFCRQTDLVCDRIYFDQGPINFIEFDKPRPAGFRISREVASEDPVTGPSSNLSTSIFVNQFLPYGYSLSVGVTGLYDRAQFVNNADSPQESAGFYNYDWSTDLSLSVFAPVPLSANYGLGDPNTLGILVARRGRDQASAQVRATINQTLLQVELAFWQLVSAVQGLEAATLARQEADEIEAFVDRQVDQQLITRGDEAQLRSRVERLRTAEESAIAALILASNQLKELLNRDDFALLLPVGYFAAFDNVLVDRGTADEVLNNPVLDTAEINVQIAELVERSAKRQVWPNLFVTGSVTLGQNSSPFGYQSPVDSLGHILNPDTVSSTIGITYTDPFLKRAARANRRSSRLARERASVSLEDTRINLVRAYETALAGLDSAQRRVSITTRNEELAQALIDRANRAPAELPSFEIAERLLQLLSAKNARIQAQIQVKTQESQVLGTLGRLAQRFPERTVQTPQDETRLLALAAAGIRRFFGGQNDE